MAWSDLPTVVVLGLPSVDSPLDVEVGHSEQRVDVEDDHENGDRLEDQVQAQDDHVDEVLDVDQGLS